MSEIGILLCFTLHTGQKLSAVFIGVLVFIFLFTLGVPTVLVVMYIHRIVMDHCFLICFNQVPLFNAKFTLDGVCTSTL